MRASFQASKRRFKSKPSFDWKGGSTHSAYREPPLDENFDRIGDVPPARPGFASKMLTSQTQADRSRCWKLESRLKIIS